MNSKKYHFWKVLVFLLILHVLSDWKDNVAAFKLGYHAQDIQP